MKKNHRKLLFVWIGHNDLRGMAKTLPPKKQQAVLDACPPGPPLDEIQSPIKVLVDQVSFDAIHLLSNCGAKLTGQFCRWLGSNAIAHPVKIANPTDYKGIFTVVDQELGTVLNERPNADAELCIHLSPGTPAMAAVWVLLGKSKYPATFYQTHRDRYWETEIPFDLAVDFVPELLRKPDAYWQRLASKSPQEIEGFQRIVGNSKSIRYVAGRAKRAAMRDVPVLLLGECGTGKELFARAIHQASHRKENPFVAINCGAIPKDLLESELFGHVKGAFTGAHKDKDGAFKTADTGTLFLDEIGELAPELQVKLLRVLQPLDLQTPWRREFSPVGGEAVIQSDVRVIAATNKDILQAVVNGEFREDLYYRLAVIAIKLPPLRERRDDIPLLAQHFLEEINQQFTTADEPGYKKKKFSDKAKKFLKEQPWPGNIRELYNVILQAMVMAEGSVLKENDFAAAIMEMPSFQGSLLDQPLGDGFKLSLLLDDIQRIYLRRAMTEARGSKTIASKLLGFNNYQTLSNQLERLNVRYDGSDD